MHMCAGVHGAVSEYRSHLPLLSAVRVAVQEMRSRPTQTQTWLPMTRLPGPRRPGPARGTVTSTRCGWAPECRAPPMLSRRPSLRPRGESLFMRKRGEMRSTPCIHTPTCTHTHTPHPLTTPHTPRRIARLWEETCLAVDGQGTFPSGSGPLMAQVRRAQHLSGMLPPQRHAQLRALEAAAAHRPSDRMEGELKAISAVLATCPGLKGLSQHGLTLLSQQVRLGARGEYYYRGRQPRVGLSTRFPLSLLLPIHNISHTASPGVFSSYSGRPALFPPRPSGLCQ